MCARCDAELASSWNGLRQRGALVVLGILAVLAVVAVQLHGELADLRVYRMAGAAVLTGADDLYRLTDPATGLPFTYPPFAALLFALLAAIGRRPAEVLLTLAGVLALARVYLLLPVRLRPARRPVVLALAAVGEPVLSTLLLGQINLLLMALVLTTMLVPRASGWWLGVAAGIKLTPAVFIVGLWMMGRRREAVQAGVAAVGTVLVGAIVLPRSSWTFWTGTGFDPSRVGGVAYISNQSLNGAVWRLTGPGGSAAWWLLLSALVALLGYRALQVQQRSGTPVGSVAVLALVGLLVSPVSWSHHWVWAVVVVAALLTPRTGPPPLHRWIVAGGWLLALVGWTVWWAPHSRDREYGADLWQQLTGQAYVLLAVLSLLVLAVDRAVTPGPDAAAGSPGSAVAPPRPPEWRPGRR